MKPVVILRNMMEAYDNRGAFGDAMVIVITSIKAFRYWTSPVVYVSEWAATVPGIIENVRARHEPHPNPTIHVMPVEHIRLALGSAHDRMALAALQMKQGVAP